MRLLRCLLASLALVAGPALARTGDGTNYTTTPNMSLVKPIPGVTGALGVEPAGKSWLELLNASLGKVDQHNHSPGYGLPVPASGLLINADVPWNSFNLTQLRTTRFTPIDVGALTALDVGTVFVSGADLYYVDTSGNQVRLTASGAIAGAPGSISGLVSPAAATYTPASALFAFTSASGYPANMSFGPVAIADRTVSGGNAVTLKVPAGLASNYNVVFPTALPASTLPVSMASTGQLSTGQVTTAQIAPLAVTAGQIANQTITATQIAPTTITASQIANGAVGPTQTTAVSAPTASQLVVRDASGRAQVADPSAAADIDTKGARDTALAGIDYTLASSTGWSNQPMGVVHVSGKSAILSLDNSIVPATAGVSGWVIAGVTAAARPSGYSSGNGYLGLVYDSSAGKWYSAVFTIGANITVTMWLTDSTGWTAAAPFVPASGDLVVLHTTYSVN